MTIAHVAAVAAILHSAHPYAQVPPKRFDHWPTIPVLFLQESIPDIGIFCTGAATQREINSLGSYTEACEETVSVNMIGAVKWMSLIRSLPDEDNRIKAELFWIENFQNFCLNRDCNGNDNVAIIVLPLTGEVSHFRMDVDYHHEIGHANGWTENHEDALPDRIPPKPKAEPLKACTPATCWTSQIYLNGAPFSSSTISWPGTGSYCFQMAGAHDVPLIKMCNDGKIEVDPDFTGDDAAHQFVDKLIEIYPQLSKKDEK